MLSAQVFDMAMRERIKWWLFPGINLHARLRYKLLPAQFGAAPAGDKRLVLDAGCGNGMLSYKSHLKGNRVRGVSIKEGEVAGCRRLFHDFLGVPSEQLAFEVQNLYALDDLDGQVDEIICSEVLEHITDDRGMLHRFWTMLKPGGVLHLCCPNADHPDHQVATLDKTESGGHVRNGYTLEAYRSLLEPAGFRILDTLGLGGPIRQAFNKRIIRGEIRWGFPAAFLLFLVALPLLPFDTDSPRAPYSIYVRAVKQDEPGS